ncbi:MAG: DUF551 domain-containing protein [Blautia sp.]|nr:DUF551 domain-containing protein [Blautia sp.]
MSKNNQNNDNEMLRILEPMMHCICDKLCIMPRKGYDQEKLDEVCNDCEVGQYSIDILNAYERAQSQAGKWIPVEEQLPEDKTVVLATVRHRRWIFGYDLGESEWYEHPERYEVCTVYRDGDEYHKMDDSDYDNISYIPVADQEEDIAYPVEEVVAWMPLPEPYKKDGDAG